MKKHGSDTKLNQEREPLAGAGGMGRRDFLRSAGYTFAAASAVSCQQAPVEKAIPYLVQPEEVTPGEALYYASVCGGCSAGCGTLVKTVDGRPVKLEGNPDHPVSRGALCPVGQASILGLYDSSRLREPLLDGRPASWSAIDSAMEPLLVEARESGKNIYFLSRSLNSPTAMRVIADFLSSFKNGLQAAYDICDHSAIRRAHAVTHGAALIPRYLFDKAEVIVSLNADFLGSWISPVEFAQGYRDGRILESSRLRFSYHAQLESRMTITGAKADRRYCVAPADYQPILVELARDLSRRARTEIVLPPPRPVDQAMVTDLASRLWGNRGKSLVVCGVQELGCQVLVNAINELLGNYRKTLDLIYPSFQAEGDFREVERFLIDLESERVGGVFILDANPVEELPFDRSVWEALREIPCTVHFTQSQNETSEWAKIVCAIPHSLESWGDSAPTARVVSLQQPTVRRLGRTRTMVECLRAWLGDPGSDREIVESHWQEVFFPRQVGFLPFREFWNKSLHAGVAPIRAERGSAGEFNSEALSLETLEYKQREGAPWLELYAAPCTLDGTNANNPWLLELPDPLSRVAWGNYLSISPELASNLDVSDGDILRLEINDQPQTGTVLATASGTATATGTVLAATQTATATGTVLAATQTGTVPATPNTSTPRTGLPELELSGTELSELSELSGTVLELPVVVQVGQHPEVLAAALGFGKSGSERFLDAIPEWIEARRLPSGTRVGGNVAPLLGLRGGILALIRPGVTLQKTGRRGEVATGQLRVADYPAELELSDEGRGLVREMSLEAILSTRPSQGVEEVPQLWARDHRFSGRHWTMAIDVGACTGCGACVVACQAENNVPVVGPDEVRRRRSMHWLRVDRYYTSTEQGDDVSFQPMMCQHCDKAPCETVCPVLATVHSEEGVNQQVYNRCIGTRYCSNNCPYKVRTFNWFDYSQGARLENLQLNPDVTVRSRGVMEKCSFCFQRILAARISAKREGREIKDGEIQTACQQTCPSRAIVFGDSNDPKSQISGLLKSPRSYRVLGELGTEPSVHYMTAVRNRESGGES